MKWRKSSYTEGESCVEVATFDDRAMGVRDSKLAASPVIPLRARAWAALVAELRE
ncbi:DUF397 domain-containing protein [Embleya scabrispora]|uniref:DUF397 domain-containing protein n=1 Tax=Embleya scabrispora TaxID=159449 RepID=UPI001F467ED2|nr:DUF397 domain-containing protein [Embleya scabrispora]